MAGAAKKSSPAKGAGGVGKPGQPVARAGKPKSAAPAKKLSKGPAARGSGSTAAQKERASPKKKAKTGVGPSTGAAAGATAGAAATGAGGKQGAGTGREGGVAAPAGSTIIVQQQQQQDAAGPWYACGLGGALLAYNAVLFFLLLALTYAAGIFVVYLFILFLMFLFAPRSESSGCNVDCGGGGGGGCCDNCCDGCDCGCGDGCCGGCDCGCGDCGGCDCGSGCDCGCATDAGMPEAPALTMAALAVPVARRAALLDAFAHHPRGPAYDQDVFCVAGARLCVGCFTTYPVFLGVIAALSLSMPAWTWWAFLALGAPLALLQIISSAGLARLRIVKVVVKAALGTGLALLVHGILQAPWPNLAQAGAMAGLLLLAMASAWPRRRRMKRACAHTQGQ